MDEEESIKKGEEEEEEENVKKKYSSLPPNYVSLAQLKERWLQRKQEEKEQKNAEAKSLNQRLDLLKKFQAMDEEESIKKGEEEEEEENVKKKYSSLPPNYVSLAQLKERWLQRKQEEKEQKNAETKSLNQENLNPKQGFFEIPQNSRNREPVVKTPHLSVHGVNSGLAGREFDGFAGANGMEARINGEKNKRDKRNKKNRTHRAQVSLRSGKGNVLSSGKIDGVEETASLCMVGVVSETESKEINPKDLIRKSGRKKRRDRKNLRKNGDWNGEGSSTKDMVEVLPENEMRVQDSAAFKRKNGLRFNDEFRRNYHNDDDDGCAVTVLDESKVKEGVLVGTGSSARFGVEVKRKGSNWRKLRDSKDKNALVEVMEKEVEDEHLIGYKGRSRQKGMVGRVIQANGNEEGVSKYLTTMVTRNFRNFSLDDSRESNMRSRMAMSGKGGQYTKYNRFVYQEMPKEVDNRFVWVKKGEIADTIVAEFDNPGRSKQEPRMDEGLK